MTVREKLVQLITEHPGITPQQMSALLGQKPGALSESLKNAMRHGQLIRKRCLSIKYPNVGQWAYYPK